MSLLSSPGQLAGQAEPGLTGALTGFIGGSGISPAGSSEEGSEQKTF